MVVFFRIENFTTFIKEKKTEEKIVTDLQQLLRATRWNKQLTVSILFIDFS